MQYYLFNHLRSVAEKYKPRSFSVHDSSVSLPVSPVAPPTVINNKKSKKRSHDNINCATMSDLEFEFGIFLVAKVQELLSESDKYAKDLVDVTCIASTAVSLKTNFFASQALYGSLRELFVSMQRSAYLTMDPSNSEVGQPEGTCQLHHIDEINDNPSLLFNNLIYSSDGEQQVLQMPQCSIVIPENSCFLWGDVYSGIQKLTNEPIFRGKYKVHLCNTELHPSLHLAVCNSMF